MGSNYQDIQFVFKIYISFFLFHSRQESDKIMSAQLMRAFNNSMYGCSPYIVGLATFLTYSYSADYKLSISLVAGTMSIFFAIRMEVTYFFALGAQGFFEGKASCQRIQVKV